MAVIEVQHLSKEYHLVKKEGGIKGALKSLVSNEKKIIHAVKDLNFSIETILFFVRRRNLRLLLMPNYLLLIVILCILDK